MSELDISRSTITILYLFGTLFSSMTLPKVGKYIDKIGVKKMAALISILLGFSCILLANVNNVFMLLLAFYLIRLSG